MGPCKIRGHCVRIPVREGGWKSERPGVCNDEQYGKKYGGTSAVATPLETQGPASE